jgi:hypothetical protein
MRIVVVLSLLSILCLEGDALALGARVSGPGFDGLVLDMPSPQKDVEVWVPEYDQIVRMEKALPAYVKNYIKVHRIVLTRPLSKYKRHYLGVREKGRRLIGTSYYSDSLEFVTRKRWLKTIGDSSAGGDEYLGSVYDVELGEFLLFEIYPKKAGGKDKESR